MRSIQKGYKHGFFFGFEMETLFLLNLVVMYLEIKSWGKVLWMSKPALIIPDFLIHLQIHDLYLQYPLDRDKQAQELDSQLPLPKHFVFGMKHQEYSNRLKLNL